MTNKPMTRYGEVIKVKPEMYEEYRHLHDNVWPGIVKKIHAAGMGNFTIFYRDGYLFKYFEYVGDDYEKDMEELGKDDENIRWLLHTDPCQEPVDSAEEGVWWAPMENIFHI